MIVIHHINGTEIYTSQATTNAKKALEEGVKKGFSFKSADLVGAYLKYANLAGADLEGADLEGQWL